MDFGLSFTRSFMYPFLFFDSLYLSRTLDCFLPRFISLLGFSAYHWLCPFRITLTLRFPTVLHPWRLTSSSSPALLWYVLYFTSHSSSPYCTDLAALYALISSCNILSPELARCIWHLSKNLTYLTYLKSISGLRNLCKASTTVVAKQRLFNERLKGNFCFTVSRLFTVISRGLSRVPRRTGPSQLLDYWQQPGCSLPPLTPPFLVSLFPQNGIRILEPKVEPRRQSSSCFSSCATTCTDALATPL